MIWSPLPCLSIHLPNSWFQFSDFDCWGIDLFLELKMLFELSEVNTLGLQEGRRGYKYNRKSQVVCTPIIRSLADITN
jgi:hypothetical protein